MFAKEESHRLDDRFVGSEQLLIGLLGSNNGASQLLNAAGARKDAAFVEVENAIGRGAGYVSIDPAFTPNAQRVVTCDRTAARNRGLGRTSKRQW